MSTEPVPFEALLAEDDVKACCAQVYESEPVRWLLGGRLHPGGDELTRRMASLAGIEAGSRVLDVASGPGTTARLLALELGAEVVGVDLGPRAVSRAREQASRAGLADRVLFVEGDAEALPFGDGEFDAVVSECSLCTFPDKAAAAGEIARVLAPGGLVAIADVTAERERLPDSLRTAAARVACVADALPRAGYPKLLEQAGLDVVAEESHDAALVSMVERVEARLRVARMLRVPVLAPYQGDIDRAVDLAGMAHRAARAGDLGYAVVAARSPD